MPKARTDFCAQERVMGNAIVLEEFNLLGKDSNHGHLRSPNIGLVHVCVWRQCSRFGEVNHNKTVVISNEDVSEGAVGLEDSLS